MITVEFVAIQPVFYSQVLMGSRMTLISARRDSNKNDPPTCKGERHALFHSLFIQSEFVSGRLCG